MGVNSVSLYQCTKAKPFVLARSEASWTWLESVQTNFLTPCSATHHLPSLSRYGGAKCADPQGQARVGAGAPCIASITASPISLVLTSRSPVAPLRAMSAVR